MATEAKTEAKTPRITNGIIDEARICLDRDVFLTLWLTIRHEGGMCQGFGGWALGGAPNTRAGEHDKQTNIAGEYIVRVFRAAGVDSFEQLRGKAVRVMRSDNTFNAVIIGIGHIIDDDKWFNVPETMTRMTGGKAGAL